MPEAPKWPEGPTTSTEEKTSSEKEEKPLPTVEQIRGEREELERKIEEDKVQKGKDIAQKLSERESLIGEAVRNDELILATRDTRDYYQTMKELGELRDPEDLKKLKEFEGLEKNLVNREAEIKGRIFTIAQQPEIREKLREETGKEVTERMEVITKKETYEKLEPRVDGVAEKIKEAAYGLYSLNEKVLKTNKEAGRVDAEANKIEKQALDAYWESAVVKGRGGRRPKRERFYSALGNYHHESRGKYLNRLEKTRKELGFFRGREKAAIDFILSRRQVLEESDQRWEEDKSLREQLFSTRKENIQKLAREVAEIRNESKTKRRGIEDYLLYERLEYKIAEIADVKRKNPKTMESSAGKYPDWQKATEADPRNEYLMELLRDIQKDMWQEMEKIQKEQEAQ